MIDVRRVATHLLLLCIGCGSSARPGLSGPTSSGATNGGRATSTGTEAVAGDSAGGEAAGGAAAIGGGNDQDAAELGGASADELQVVEVMPGEALPLDSAPQLFIPPNESFFAFDRAGVVGRRRFALDTASLALLTFEADGTGASDVLQGSPVAAVGRGDELDVLELDETQALVAVAFDDQLGPLPGSLKLSGVGTGSHALAASSDRVVAVWSQALELRGQLFDADGAIGDGFDFGPRSCDNHGCRASAIWDGQRFSILWSRVNGANESLLSWGTIDAQGAALSARNVLSSKTEFHLVDATSVGDGRVAVLLTLGSPASSPLLLFLDRFGALENTLHVYRGASEAWSVASDGVSLLIAARSNQSQGVIRKLDLMGEPLSEWLIADDSRADTAFEPRVALFADDAASSAVVRMTDGSSVILNTSP